MLIYTKVTAQDGSKAHLLVRRIKSGIMDAMLRCDKDTLKSKGMTNIRTYWGYVDSDDWYEVLV